MSYLPNKRKIYVHTFPSNNSTVRSNSAQNLHKERSGNRLFYLPNAEQVYVHTVKATRCHVATAAQSNQTLLRTYTRSEGQIDCSTYQMSLTCLYSKDTGPKSELALQNQKNKSSIRLFDSPKGLRQYWFSERDNLWPKEEGEHRQSPETLILYPLCVTYT